MAYGEGFELFGMFGTDWTGTATGNTELMGQLVMHALNPYHNQPNTSSMATQKLGWRAMQYQAGFDPLPVPNPPIVPADPDAWQRMIQVERREKKGGVDRDWSFADSAGVADYTIRKAARIPYYLRKGPIAGGATRYFLEHLLVGFSDSVAAAAPNLPWDPVGAGASDLKELGRVILRTAGVLAGAGATLNRAAGWDSPFGAANVDGYVVDAGRRHWQFRATTQKIDRSVRFTVFGKNVNNLDSKLFLFVGYEGGAAY